MSSEAKHISAFTGIGPLIGVIIGGTYHGIAGAMAGGVLGGILISSGIEVQVKQLRSEGRFRPFKGAVAIAYVLGVALTFGALQVAPLVSKFLSEGGKDSTISMIILYLGPAFAGGIGACIPVWVSGATGNRS